MAFKIAQKPSYEVTVKVSTPNDKNGFDTSDFKAKFKRVGMEELDELRKLPQKEVLQRVMVGFSDLLDEDNAQIDFNEINFNALMDIPQAQSACSEAFWESIFKAKAKN